MKSAPTLRTAAVLAAFDPETPTRIRDVAHLLGVPARKLCGHLHHLLATDRIARVGRGQYLRTLRGDWWLAADNAKAAA